jgi:hypothetical protein
VATRTIKIKIKQSIETEVNPSGLRGLQQELKKTKSALVDATDPKELEQLSVKAAALKDQIMDLNDEVKAFQGSKFEQVSGQLGMVGNSIKNLDFEKASQQAKTLISISKGITFKEAISGVSNLGKTFLNLGKALLTNPLFLIGAVIAALVFAIIKLSDKLGLLKKITEAVGKAMDALWQIAKRVLSIIPAFRDAFQTEDMIKDADKRIAAYKKEEAAVGGKYDFEIRKLQAAGLSTEEAERQKRNAILLTLKAQNDALRSLIQAGNATEDQIKVWNENQAKIKTLKDDAIIAEIAAEKRAKDEYAKLQAERSKAAIDAAKKAADEAKKYAEDRRNFERVLRDLEIAAIANDLERELASNNEKYARLIDDTLRNQNLLETEKEALILAYEQERERNKQAALQRETELEQAELQKRQDAKLKQEEDFQKEYLKMLAEQSAEEKRINDERLATEKLVNDTKEALALNAISAISANLEQGSKAAKGIAAAQAGYDAIRGAQASFASTAANPISIAFPAAPFIAAGTALAFGLANVRKILASPAKSSSAPSSGGSASASKPSTGQLTAGAPAFNLFGQGNNLNETNAAENREQGQTQMTVKAVVSETEITDTQERVSKLRQTAEL